MKTSITLDLRKTGQKYLNITYHISDLTDKNLVLNFPSWAPGSYLLREYQGHVEDIAMRDSQGRIVKHEKLNKNQWKFQNIKTKSVTLTYRLYANDLSVRGAYADHELVCVTPCTAFFYPDKKQGLNLSLKIQLPSGWKLALAKKTTKEIYSFKSFDDFFDTPLLAAKDHIIKQFKTQNTNYKMAFWGTCFTDINKIVEDVKKAVAKQNSLFRENPCKEYLFQVIFTSNVKAGVSGGAGGLEHRLCSLNIFDGSSLDSDKQYKKLLALLSHEHFHLWNVKRIKPRIFDKYDYTKEMYTKDLWMVEGITSYYDDHSLFRAGIYTKEDYLAVISDFITKLEVNKAAKVNTMSESSFDAWTRWYRPNENTFNRTVSYYLKGGLVMMLLDLKIINHTKGKQTLDDVMRALYKFYKKRPKLGITRKEFFETVEKITGFSTKNFVANYLDNTTKIHWKKELEPFGIKISLKREADQGYLGITLKQRADRVYIQHVAEDSPAYFSNLQAEDEVIALNKECLTNTEQFEYFLTKKTLNVIYNRRGRIYETEVKLADKSNPAHILEIKDKMTAKQKRYLAKFLRK